MLRRLPSGAPRCSYVKHLSNQGRRTGRDSPSTKQRAICKSQRSRDPPASGRIDGTTGVGLITRSSRVRSYPRYPNPLEIEAPDDLTVNAPRVPLEQRRALARAVINLRDTGKLSGRQAAAAIIDLENKSQTLIRASLINAIFIKTGQMRTPGGLRLAA